MRTDLDVARLQLHVSPEFREAHDHRRDTAFAGGALRRLPDRTLVRAEDYPYRLAEYRRRQEEGDDR